MRSELPARARPRHSRRAALSWGLAGIAPRREIEGYYTKIGCLLPTYHKSYWIGLRVLEDASDRSFTWLDGSPGALPSSCSLLGTPTHGAAAATAAAAEKPG